MFVFILKSLDIITTTIAVSIWGIEVEANPILRYCMESWLRVEGALGVSFVVSLWAFLLCSSRFPPRKKWIPGLTASVILLPVVVGNTIQLILAPL